MSKPTRINPVTDATSAKEREAIETREKPRARRTESRQRTARCFSIETGGARRSASRPQQRVPCHHFNGTIAVASISRIIPGQASWLIVSSVWAGSGWLPNASTRHLP